MIFGFKKGGDASKADALKQREIGHTAVLVPPFILVDERFERVDTDPNLNLGQLLTQMWHSNTDCTIEESTDKECSE